MSGILNKKQRLIDFNLTKNGYKQIENGDLRFVYASLTDKDIIYSKKQGEYNVSDIDASPFFFEVYSKYSDTLNTEIDIKNISNFSLKTELNNSFINLVNNTNSNIESATLETVFNKISNDLLSNLKNECIILSDSYISNIKDYISLFLYTINNNEVNVLLEDEQILNYMKDGFFEITIPNNYPTIQNPVTNFNRYSLLEDDRFINKLNYLFLPPSNINNAVISKNNELSNMYNVFEDKRKSEKLLYKKLDNLILTNTNTTDILTQIKNLELASLDKINDIQNTKKISKIEFKFENKEFETEFLISLLELKQQDQESVINKLLFINHGEIFDSAQNKNKQVYSAGKLFKTKIDLQNKTTDYIDDEINYIFINLFTIVIE